MSTRDKCPIAIGIVANDARVLVLGLILPIRGALATLLVVFPVPGIVIARTGFKGFALTVALAVHPVTHVGIPVLGRHLAEAVAFAQTEIPFVDLASAVDLCAHAVRNAMLDSAVVLLLAEVVEAV